MIVKVGDRGKKNKTRGSRTALCVKGNIFVDYMKPSFFFFRAGSTV